MSGGLNSLISVAAVPAAKEESSSEEESSEEEEEVAAPAVVAAPGNYIYLCYICFRFVWRGESQFRLLKYSN